MAVISETDTFERVREQTYKLWEATTFRKCEGVNDDRSDSYECMWQYRAESKNYQHISVFCSLGEWANNITDILKDTSCDQYTFLNPEHCQALFRYYTRMLLVTSEMLSDFEKIVIIANSVSNKDARAFLSDNPIGVDELVGFINTVCKHKADHIHLCNHHLPIWFDDCSIVCPYPNPIRVGRLNFKQSDSILMPKFADLLMTIVICYNRVQDLFEQNEGKFNAICTKYVDQTISPMVSPSSSAV